MEGLGGAMNCLSNGLLDAAAAGPVTILSADTWTDCSVLVLTEHRTSIKQGDSSGDPAW